MGLPFFTAYKNYRTFLNLQKKHRYDIAFYSEQKGDLNYFGAIIEGLQKKYKILYLTSDPNDLRFKDFEG